MSRAQSILHPSIKLNVHLSGLLTRLSGSATQNRSTSTAGVRA